MNLSNAKKMEKIANDNISKWVRKLNSGKQFAVQQGRWRHMTKALKDVEAYKERRFKLLQHSSSLAGAIRIPENTGQGMFGVVRIMQVLSLLIFDGELGTIEAEPSELVVDFGEILSISSVGGRLLPECYQRTLKISNNSRKTIDINMETTNLQNFSVFPTNHVQITPGTSVDVQCSVDFSLVGSLESSFQISSSTLLSTVCLKARLQPLIVDFSCQCVDFGYVLADNNGQCEKCVTIRNKTGVVLMVKAQVQELESHCHSSIKVDLEKFFLQPYDQETFKVLLNTTEKVEDVKGCILVGVGGESNLKMLDVNAKVAQPLFDLSIDGIGKIGGNMDITLPAAKKGTDTVSTLNLFNKGQVPLDFCFTPCTAGIDVSPESGIICCSHQKSFRVRIHGEGYGQHEERIVLSMKGRSSETVNFKVICSLHSAKNESNLFGVICVIFWADSCTVAWKFFRPLVLKPQVKAYLLSHANLSSL